MPFEKDLKHVDREVPCQAFAGWEQYPANLTRDPASIDCPYYSRLIAELGSSIFSSRSEECNVNIIDISYQDQDQDQHVLETKFFDNEKIENYVLRSPEPEIRIVSLCSENSIGPLQISEETTMKLLTYYDIGTEFADLLFSFGNKPRDSEAGLGSMTMKQAPDGAYDVSYSMVYVEPSKYGTKTSWPVRQTGVFHRFYPKSRRGLWIFLNPMPNSKVQQRLSHISNGSTDWQQLDLLVISSYINNWRWYLNDLHDQFENTVDMAMTLDFAQPSDLPLGLKTLSRLQHLQDKILPLTARFEASRVTINQLLENNKMLHDKGHYDDAKFTHVSNELGSYARKVQGYFTSTDVLKSRAQGILKLLAVTLDLKNQMTSVDINNNMLSLTKDTVDDSATVRVVTIVTLVYLPASFVATLLGMNLFTFQTNEGSGFQISQQFWIYIILSVPLTVLTLGSWFVFSKRRKREDTQKHEGAQVKVQTLKTVKTRSWNSWTRGGDMV